MMQTATEAGYFGLMSSVARTLGTNLRSIRARLGLTQVQASERTGVPQNTLSAWERGAVFRQLDDIERAIVALGADPMELLRPPSGPENEELAALFADADPTTREIVLGVLRMRARTDGGGRAAG